MTAAHNARQWTPPARRSGRLQRCESGDRRAFRGGARPPLAARPLPLRGAQLRADEGVFIRGTDAVGLPRRVHLKAGTFDVLPEIKAQRFAVSSLRPAPVWALDPSTLPAEPNGGSAVRGIDLVLILDGWDEGPTSTRSDARIPGDTVAGRAIRVVVRQSRTDPEKHRCSTLECPVLQTDSDTTGDTGADTVEELVASCVTPGI